MKHPKEQRFYRVMAFALGSLSLNGEFWNMIEPPRYILYLMQRIAIIILTPLMLVSQVVYIYLYHDDHNFSALTLMFSIFLVTCIVTVKVFMARTKAYKQAMEDFVPQIHLYNVYKNNKDDIFIKKTLSDTEKLVRWSNYYLLAFCYPCWAGFEIVPMIHNYQNNDSIHNITVRLEIILHSWMPFDYEYNFTNWVIVQILMIYCGFLAISIVAMFDTTNLIFIYHVIGHIKIFKHRVKTLLNAELTQETIHNNLIEITKNYTFIKLTIQKIEAAFGLNVATIYFHNLIAGSLFFYEMSTSGTNTETILTYGLSVPLYMGILIIISLTLEYIRIAADKIPDVVYSIKWEDMSVRNQRMVLMLLFQVQPTLEFTAAFQIKTGMQPAINIIKTTFSYYVMIKSSRGES